MSSEDESISLYGRRITRALSSVRPRACDGCRRKKVRCNTFEGKTNTVCGNCLASGMECTYKEPAAKRGHSRAYVQSLEDRIEKMESYLLQYLSEAEFRAMFGERLQQMKQAVSTPLPESPLHGSDFHLASSDLSSTPSISGHPIRQFSLPRPSQLGIMDRTVDERVVPSDSSPLTSTSEDQRLPRYPSDHPLPLRYPLTRHLGPSIPTSDDILSSSTLESFQDQMSRMPELEPADQQAQKSEGYPFRRH